MDELETRLGKALRARVADTDAVPQELAHQARRRARGRRSTVLAGASAAVLLVGVGVPLVVGHVSEGPTSSGPVASTTPSPSPATELPDRGWVPPGWRVESWRGVQLAVPDSWEYGSLSDWCADGDELEPRVERPGTLVQLVDCGGSTYGLKFLEKPLELSEENQLLASFPEGYAMLPFEVGGVHGFVVTDDPGLSKAIGATVQATQGVDANGCPASADVPALSQALTVRPSDAEPWLSVCRYSVGVEGANLEQSELLPTEAVDDVLAALEEGDRITVASLCRAYFPDEQAVAFRDATGVVAWVRFGGCAQGVDVSEGVLALSPDILWWALSPGWSGSVPRGVPLEGLRR